MGESGITLYTVGSVKVIPKIRTYVSIDGGMTDNPRYALYKSSYLAVIADKAASRRWKRSPSLGNAVKAVI